MSASLAAFVAAPIAGGFASAQLSGGPEETRAFYAAIRPTWSPPAWVFAPVWTVLYVLMGIAAWLVWTAAGGTWTCALTWWAAQLALNAAWSPAFFGMRRPGLALVVLLANFAAAAVTARKFHKSSPAAGALMLPILLWTAYAGVLNASIYYKARRVGTVAA